MKFMFILLFPLQLFAQEADTLDLQDLVREALRNNPELKAFEYNRDMMELRTKSEGVLPDPELTYMREEMPKFRWNAAMMQKIGLMQAIPFPGKLSLQTDLAEIRAEHAHHEHMEKANDVLAQLRSMYFELWYVQQATALNRENTMLLQQFTSIAQTRYGVGQTPQQDVLKAYVEVAKLENQVVALRQQEQSAKAMLHALLNRPQHDTLGIAAVPPDINPLPSLDTLQRLAMKYRGMLLHDSLSVEEGEKMKSLTSREYLPDLKLGIEYLTMPDNPGFRAWTVSAGISLPFAPWSLGRTGARVEEADIGIDRARETLRNSRNMVLSSISDLHFKAVSFQRQLENYTTVVEPQTRQALQASMMAYQTGRTDFLMLVDSYRTLVDVTMEKLMLRMQFEQAVAQLKREVGYAGIFEKRD